MIQVQPTSFTSAKKFLADTAAGLVFFLAAYIAAPFIQKNLSAIVAGDVRILASVTALLLAYPFGLLINALSFFLLHWLVTFFESQLFDSKLVGGTIKRLYGSAEALDFFGIEEHKGYYQPSRLLEEIDFVFAKFGVDSRRTSGIEQFVRNLALIIPAILLLHSSARSSVSWAILGVVLGAFFLAGLLLCLAGAIALYRGLKYLSLAYSLNRIFLPEKLEEAEKLELHERLDFSIRNLVNLRMSNAEGR